MNVTMDNRFNGLEILKADRIPSRPISTVVFDFDGTFSTIRCGWELVMRPLMLEMISGTAEKFSPELENEVTRYIDSSTGIQTIYQMQWLENRVKEAGHAVPGRDAWWYKDQYNERLMIQVRERLSKLQGGFAAPENFLISGAVDFVRFLCDRGVSLYLASGTDHRDVLNEADALGVAQYFTEIRGAPERRADCSKEAVIRDILKKQTVSPTEVLIIGDGKVEIELGCKFGTYNLGMATDEVRLSGVNQIKRQRLIKAGADAISGDFSDLKTLSKWMGY